MAKGLWLPKRFKLPDGSKIRSPIVLGDDWQSFSTTRRANILNENERNYILLIRPFLAQKWQDNGFIDVLMFGFGDPNRIALVDVSLSLLGEVTFVAASFPILSRYKKYALAPVGSGKSTGTKVDAIAFALSFCDFNKILFGNEILFGKTNKKDPNISTYISRWNEYLQNKYKKDNSLALVDMENFLTETGLTAEDVVEGEDFFDILGKYFKYKRMPMGSFEEDSKDFLENNAGLPTQRKPEFRPKTDEKAAVADAASGQGQLQSQFDKVAPKIFRLPGRPQLEEFFNEHVIEIIFNPEKYRKFGIEFPSAIVLHGPPGCGKTFAVERLIEFIGWPSYSIDSNSIGSAYIHRTSKKISGVFDKAIGAAPAVIVIDEMESFFSDRQSGGTSRLYHIEEVAEFLRCIPQAIKNKVLIIAMTNLIGMIDPAILRHGRFDHIIEVGMPSRIEVASLLDSLLAKFPKTEDLKLDAILDALTGKALSYSAFVVREAARLAAKSGKSQLDGESIDAALRSLPEDKEKKRRGIGFVWDS